MSEKLFTAKQLEILQDLCDTHGLQPEQISFEERDETPIFDYEAVCLLSLKLTDIQSIDCWVSAREILPFSVRPVDNAIQEERSRSTAKCTITLPDGRSRTCEDSAEMYEILGNGMVIDSVRLADSSAQNRAVRRGIRSVGVNLWHAHKKFKENGQVASGHTNHDPRLTIYNEIHALATELDLIVDSDKRSYQNLIAELYGGVTSAKDLNDIEIRQFLITLRAMAGRSRFQSRQAKAVA